MESGQKIGQQNQEIRSWIADNQRLVVAALRNGVDGPLDSDWVTLEMVRQRCISRYGEMLGNNYFMNLALTLPEVNKDLFPEIFETDVSETPQL
jgi:hypothetical protein